MKTLTILALLLTSLFASSERKIIVASFKNMQEAQRSLSKFNILMSQELHTAQEKYNFNITARSSKNLYILTLEPFNSYKEAKQVHALLPTKYSTAFINKYTSPQGNEIPTAHEDELQIIELNEISANIDEVLTIIPRRFLSPSY